MKRSREGFFTESPTTTRSRWAGLGCGVAVLAFFAFIGVSATIAAFTSLSVLPTFGLGVVAVMVMMVGRAMPKRTDKGAEEAAKWKAFMRYMAEHREVH